MTPCRCTVCCAAYAYQAEAAEALAAEREAERKLLAEEAARERERCAAYATEIDRLRKLFDDAGQREHNVLALVDHYQRASMEADERLRAVRKLLEEHGCDCPCDHHADEHGPDCEVCLGCRIEKVLRGGAR